MALEDMRKDMSLCAKCNICKFIPLERVKGGQPVNVCPSIARYNFNSYSGGGRVNIGMAMLENRLEYTDKLMHIVYNCQVCGACDVSCKYAMDMEVLEPIIEFRIKCVEDGQSVPALKGVMGCLRKQGSMVPGKKTGRGEWAEGLKVKDIGQGKTPVLYHAGCRTCYDQEMWKISRANINLLQKAGVDIGIAGGEESCCGGRAYHLGYKDDFLKQAKANMARLKKAGVKTLVTGCAECYQAFKVLYDRFNLKGEMEVVHTAEYFARLIKEGKLKPSKKVNLEVTYHDPCHLGRMGESWIHWSGKEIPGDRRRFEPPREFRRGTKGVYEPPRDVLKSIPGLKLNEMDRIKEYAWCCGAGGGVIDTNPEFAQWTARDRIKEAQATGAEAIVTACPWCLRNFQDTLKADGNSLKVYDIVELLEKAVK
jgi:Fe-S oxidoreductase